MIEHEELVEFILYELEVQGKFVDRELVEDILDLEFKFLDIKGVIDFSVE